MLIFADCQVVFLLSIVNYPQVVVGFNMVRFGAQRCFVIYDGLVVAALRIVQHAQCKVSLGVIRLDLDGVFKYRNRFVMKPQVFIEYAEVVIGI